MYGVVDAKLWTRRRRWPWTIARTVPSWSWTTWAILAKRADRVQLGRVVDVLVVRPDAGSPARSGQPLSTAALSAWTDLSRPTWSGTIISGKMTVSRSATSGSSRCRLDPEAFGCLARCASVERVAIRVSCRRGAAPSRDGSRSLGPALRRLGSRRGDFIVEAFQDAGTESLLELEEDADAGEVHAQVLGQVPDPQDPTDVVLAIEPDVGPGPGRAEQALVLVDPQRARMDADQLAATLITKTGCDGSRSSPAFDMSSLERVGPAPRTDTSAG